MNATFSNVIDSFKKERRMLFCARVIKSDILCKILIIYELFKKKMKNNLLFDFV